MNTILRTLHILLLLFKRISPNPFFSAIQKEKSIDHVCMAHNENLFCTIKIHRRDINVEWRRLLEREYGTAVCV